jgi:hypothetical protein
MHRFLTCLSIAALTILPSAIKVCAEPPPVELETVIVASDLGSLGDCGSDCP